MDTQEVNTGPQTTADNTHGSSDWPFGKVCLLSANCAKYSLHHVFAEAQAVQQLGGPRLKGGGVQLIQAVVDSLQSLIIWAML
jgi:hypothetical protein